MTTIEITAATKVNMLKQLVAGHDLEFVATTTRIPRDTILDIVSTHGYPDHDRMAWAVDMLIQGSDKIPERPTASLNTGTPLDPAAPARAQSTGQRNPGFAVIAPATIAHIPPATADLLHQGKASPWIRTQNLAAKIHNLLGDLTARLADEQAAAEAKARVAHENALVASRIATLQAEIDKLKRKPARPATARAAKTAAPKTSDPTQTDSATIRSWAWANNIDCPKTGAVNKAIRDAYHAAHTAGAA
jgi:hypothetical protein